MEPSPLSLDGLEALVTTRRTNLRVDPDRLIEPGLVDRLVRLVVWAPNHKQTHPWRFAVVEGDGRRRLGETIAAFEATIGASAEKVAKARRKYLRAPVVVMVGAAYHPSPVRRSEDRDSVAAGVQNLLLGATAAGLASHWATGTWMDDPAVKALAGLEPDDALIALVYLGWPLGDVPVPARPAPVVVRLQG